MSKTFRNIFDKGYKTYHDSGTKSTTYKNTINDGYTTYHSDGRTSHTYKNFLNNGYTTYHSTSGSGSGIWGLILALVAVGSSVYECGTAIIFPCLMLFIILPVIVFVLRRTYIKPIWTIYGYTYFLLSLYPVIMNADITIPLMNFVLCGLFSILVLWILIGYGCFLDDTSGILDFIVLFLVFLNFILYIVTKNKSVSGMNEFLIASLAVQVVLILISQIKYIKYAKDIRKSK
jgi:uncharacterized membrane protein (GlpM family)